MADSPSGSRPLMRTGGIALLGVGVIAATIGLFTSATTGNGTGTAVPSASSQALPSATAGAGEATAPVAEPAPTAAPDVVAPPATAAAPDTAGAPAVPNGAPSAPPVAEAPPAPPVAAPAPDAGSAPRAGSGSDGQAARAPVRVLNNSLITGLAARARSDFEVAGWNVTDASNYSGQNIPTSTVYYRPGTGEEAAARNLARTFDLKVEPRFSGLDGGPGVVVIVTNDYHPSGKAS